MTNTQTLHGSEVRDGKTYCTDCGARLEVGSYETMIHRDPVSHSRGVCPHARLAKSGKTVSERFDYPTAADAEADRLLLAPHLSVGSIQRSGFGTYYFWVEGVMAVHNGADATKALRWYGK